MLVSFYSSSAICHADRIHYVFLKIVISFHWGIWNGHLMGKFQIYNFSKTIKRCGYSFLNAPTSRIVSFHLKSTVISNILEKGPF